jgi:predicted oxidoreductase
MIFQRLLKKLANSKAISNDIELGNGKAELLSAGTYEEYQNEQETAQTWLQYVAERLKIDR